MRCNRDSNLTAHAVKYRAAPSEFNVTEINRAIVELYADGRLVNDSQYVQQGLVDQIQDRLLVSTDSKILVYYSIEWAVNLKFRGYSDVTLITDTVNPSLQKISTGLGIKYIITDMLTPSTKFSAVVGNPPYQNGSNSDFYKQFISRAKQLSDTVAFIVPATNFKDLKEFNNLTHYSYQGEAFKGIRILASWFIWQRGYDGDCTVISNGQEFTVKSPRIAPTDNVAGYQLAESILQRGLPGLVVNAGKLSRNRSVPDDNGVWCIWSAGRRNQDFDKIKVSLTLSDQLSGFNEHKVVFSGDYTTTAIGPVKYAGLDHGCALKAHYIKVDNQTEASNLISYLESKFIKALVSVIKGTSTKNGKTVFKMLPVIDLSRSWTDADIYAHFNLTQAEIDYIESHGST